MPAILFRALVIYEAIFFVRMLKATKKHKAEQTEESKKALDRETIFLIAGGAAFVVIQMLF